MYCLMKVHLGLTLQIDEVLVCARRLNVAISRDSLIHNRLVYTNKSWYLRVYTNMVLRIDPQPQSEPTSCSFKAQQMTNRYHCSADSIILTVITLQLGFSYSMQCLCLVVISEIKHFWAS